MADGVTTEYRMAGDLLVSEITNGQTFWYHYDSGANLISIVIGGKNYFYVRNLQNDVIALVDEDGNEVVHYTYDSWGKILSITGSLKDTVGQQNPFRYRGYFYDTETGMYYLKSRYYDPELRRFISADSVMSVTASMETFHNRNLYAYCDGNPLSRKDESGDFIISRSNGEDVQTSVINAVVEGGLAFGWDRLGKRIKAGDYLNLTRARNKRVAKIKKSTFLHENLKNKKIKNIEKQYKKEMAKTTVWTAASGGINSKISPYIQKRVNLIVRNSKSERPMRMVFMYDTIYMI